MGEKMGRGGLWDRLWKAAWTGALRNQLLWGLGFYLLLLVVLVATAINGTSAGMLYGDFFSGKDPRLLLGAPRAVRSDEWLVATPLTIAQVQEGLPRISDVFPGGMDVSIVWDMPYRDWSILFRPHNLGFFFLPIDNAFALKWWLPLIAMGMALFVLLCTLWRNVVGSLAVSLAFALSPFMQWWFGSGSFWPPAFAFLTCAVVIWMLQTERTWVRWGLGALAGYVAAVAAIALYPPFLIPCVLAAAAFSVGWLLKSVGRLGWRTCVQRLVPLLVGGAAAGATTALFLATRSSTVKTVMSTVYPGQRLWPTGQRTSFPWQAMYAGVFGQGLTATDPSAFAVNASEGSSFLFVGLYLIPTALWLLWSRARRRKVDWPILCTLLVLGVFLLFVYVPGWDAVAHLLLLDRTTLPRLVIGLGVVSILLLGLVVHGLRVAEDRGSLWQVVLPIAIIGVNHAAMLRFLRRHAPAILDAIPLWPVWLMLLVVAVALFALGRITVPSVLFLVVAVALTANVNPVYRGVLDLRHSDIAREIAAVEAQDPGTWVAVGDVRAVAVLRETGVEAYSGVQAWPTKEMWEQIDPTETNAQTWNRYAHLWWTADPAAPAMRLVQADVVLLKFDSCAAFAQSDVDYVLSQGPLDQSCVRKVADVVEESADYWVYKVVPAGS